MLCSPGWFVQSVGRRYVTATLEGIMAISGYHIEFTTVAESKSGECGS